MPRLTREQSRGRTVAALVEAAAGVFLDKGFDAATVEEIAEQAGFSTGALYANFAGKADLLAAVGARSNGTASESLVADEDIEGYIRRLQAWGLQRRIHRKEFLLNGELFLRSMHDRGYRQAQAQQHAEAYAELDSVFKRIVRRSRLDPALSPEVAAVAFLALTDGLAVLAWFEPELVPVDLAPRAAGAFLGIEPATIDKILGSAPGLDLRARTPVPQDDRRDTWRGVADAFGRARERQRKTEEITIPALLDAAERAFRTVGYAQVTVDEVAAAAGFKRMAVYECFGGKDGLFLAVLERKRLTPTAVLINATRSVQTPDGLLTVLGSITAQRRRTTFSYFLKNAAFWLQAARQSDLCSWIVDQVNRDVETLRARLETVAEVEDVSPRLGHATTAVALIALNVGLDARSFLNPDLVPADLLASACAAMVGIVPPA